MKIPPPDLVYIRQQIDRLGRELVDAWRDAGSPRDGLSPEDSLDAARRLLDVLHGHERPAAGNAARNELKALGEHGLQLLQELAEQSRRLDLAPHAREFRHLSFPFALWLARSGGEFAMLEPVADAVAELANRLSTPRDQAEFYPMIRELCDAANTGAAPAPRPGWRVLVFNRAVVATRSHQPTLMEEAFSAVGEHLPDDAPDFFEEAMEQADIEGHPASVREVVARYYRVHRANRTLH
jgi:hypothetical protein